MTEPGPADIVRHVAGWCDGQPYVRAVHAFGSRIRGDARPESDLDILIDIQDGEPVSDEAVAAWVPEQRDFSSLRRLFPKFPLHILVLQRTHGPSGDPAVAGLLRASRQPMLSLGRAHAVLTRRTK